ncbi:MAG: hypothetical protein QCI00_04595 [Candidatus Thermoplasmatota archaeon]|nr:hypothetical protein [Candidatus Thermoplasmatota archaeon]
MKVFEDDTVHYAMGLRRDFPLVKHVSQSKSRDYFRYRKRAQWYQLSD